MAERIEGIHLKYRQCLECLSSEIRVVGSYRPVACLMRPRDTRNELLMSAIRRTRAYDLDMPRHGCLEVPEIPRQQSLAPDLLDKVSWPLCTQ